MMYNLELLETEAAIQAEAQEQKEKEALGLPPDTGCSRQGCSVIRNPNDPYLGCNELQKVALFLGYSDGRLLGTPEESNFTAAMKSGAPGGDAEHVKGMLRAIVKDQTKTERKAAVKALKDYQNEQAIKPAADAINTAKHERNNQDDEERSKKVMRFSTPDSSSIDAPPTTSKPTNK